MSRLENWRLVNRSLHGLVYDDPRFSDGTLVMTSALKAIDFENSLAFTANTEYRLGKEYDTGTVQARAEAI